MKLYGRDDFLTFSFTFWFFGGRGGKEGSNPRSYKPLTRTPSLSFEQDPHYIIRSDENPYHFSGTLANFLLPKKKEKKKEKRVAHFDLTDCYLKQYN